MKFKQFIVIGGGLVGLASPLKLAPCFSGCHVVVLEKESEVGRQNLAMAEDPQAVSGRWLDSIGIQLLDHGCGAKCPPRGECGEMTRGTDKKAFAIHSGWR